MFALDRRRAYIDITDLMQETGDAVQNSECCGRSLFIGIGRVFRDIVAEF
jgi:hypothetical protein